MLPPWLMVTLMAVVGTAVLATGQGLYWAYVARKDRENEELLRRLGSGTGAEDEEGGLFREAATDSVAAALGGLGASLQASIRAADSNITVSTLLTRMMLAAGGGMVAGGIGVGPVGMVIGLAAGYVPLWLMNSAGKARAKALVEQLPDSLELMARSLSAGLGLADAFKLVSEEMPMPIAGEFGRLCEEVRFGRDYREAFDKLLGRNPGIFDLRIFVSSIMLQRETGGNLIEILESISDTIRARFLFDAKVRAMTSEARTSALILGSLPFCVIGILLVMNPIYLVPLTTTLPGKALIFCGSFMYIVGITIMRDLTNVQV